MKPWQKVLQYVLLAISIASIILLSYFLSKKSGKERVKEKQIKRMLITSIFGAFSYILYLLKFPLPFFPAFLKFQLSNLPAYVIGFSLGPINGVLVIVIKTFLKIPITDTYAIGEFADLLIGVFSIFSSSIIYSKFRTKNGAIFSLIISVFVWIAVSVFANFYILVPFYINLYFNSNPSGFINLLSKTIPNITDKNYLGYFVIYSVIPFNLILSSATVILTFVIYKKISYVINNELVINEIELPYRIKK